MSGRESPPPDAQDHLRAMLHQRRERLVNRLSHGQLPAERNDEIAEEVDYLDSSGLGMLLMLREKAQAANKTVSLRNCRGAVRQVLDIANFAKLFTIK